MRDLNTCIRPRIPRDAQGLRLSLHLLRLRCVDETEHEGIWPFVGEGIANDAMRLLAIVTQGSAESATSQCKTDIMNLGDNYEDNTTVTLNREVTQFFRSSESEFPFVTNIVLMLIEEDYGGIDWDAGVIEAITTIGGVASAGVQAAVGAGVGGAIGTSLGPIGTGIGSAIGALAGLITAGITGAIRSAESDIFPPLDLSIRLDSSEAVFAGDSPTRKVGTHTFTGFGGEYELTYEWRLNPIRPLPESNPGMRSLFHWWNPIRQDNFLTANPRWSSRIGDTEGKYQLYRIEGQVFDPRRPQPDGTIPLFSLWNGDRTDNFITSNPNWGMPLRDIRWSGSGGGISNKPVQDGYSLYRVEGFIYDPRRPQPPNTMPLFSWWNPDRMDNFATTNRYWSLPLDDRRWRGERIIGGPVRNGYSLSRLEGYVSR